MPQPVTRPLILIPARRAATRLPDKPLALIGDVPMIVQVWRRATEAKLARVVVACDDVAIQQAVEAAGGEAVLTNPDHPSGSDRIWEALQRVDPDAAHDVIINMQGDLPTLDPALLHALLPPFAQPDVDITTLAAEIDNAEDKTNPSVVKPVISFYAPAQGRALYFTRAAAPSGDGPLYHHIGIYAYRRSALARFVAAAPSELEKREKLEQLRALELSMRIDVCVVSTNPLGVDTPADLEKARALLCTG